MPPLPLALSFVLTLLAVPTLPPALAAQDPTPRALAPGEELRLQELAREIHAARDTKVADVEERGDEALAILAARPDPELELRLRLDLSWSASRNGAVEAGLEHARRAGEIAERLGRATEETEADYHLALAQWYGTRPRAAIATLEDAIAEQRRLGARELLARSLTLLGAVHRSRSTYDEALAAHLEALDLALEDADLGAVARSRNNIALIYWELDDHDRAHEYLAEALRLYEELGKEAARASALSNLALILVEKNEPAAALPHLEEALRLQEHCGNPRTKARLLSNRGYAFERLGRPGAALEDHLRALALREELAEQHGLARTLANIGRLYLEQNEFEVSRPYLERAAAAAELAEARDELADIHELLARRHEAVGDYREALKALRRRADLDRELDLPETSRRIAELEARTHLDAQQIVLQHERTTRNIVLGILLIVLAAASIGWQMFAWKRRAHDELLRLHLQVAEHAAHLEEAHGQIRELEGLLPICSYCKSIRDEGGEWQPLESYLYHRSGTQLSHGICPSCYDRVVETDEPR